MIKDLITDLIAKSTWFQPNYNEDINYTDIPRLGRDDDIEVWIRLGNDTKNGFYKQKVLRLTNGASTLVVLTSDQIIESKLFMLAALLKAACGVIYNHKQSYMVLGFWGLSRHKVERKLFPDGTWRHRLPGSHQTVPV